jgi:MFS family permease
LTAHPLITSLRGFQGNVRACVYTEPLWGISYNIYIPYASLYMISLGLTDSQIGMITTLGLVLQTAAAFLSGAVTDKVGRRWVVFFGDMVGWAIPALIWSLSQNVTYFIVATLFNSFFRISSTAWTCLMVEDTDPEVLVDMYTWIYIFAITAAFISPLSGWLIGLFGLVPAMRAIYITSAILFASKAVILLLFSKETTHGKLRLHETKQQSLISLLGEYREVINQLLKTPQTLYTLGLMTVMSITSIITSTFWSVIAAEKIHIPEAQIALFPFIRSMVMLVFFFGILPRMGGLSFKRPMLWGYATFILAQVILVLVPEKSIGLLVISIVLDAFSVAMVSPQVDKLSIVTVDPDERARIMSILFMGTLIVSSPFGWIAGSLSSIDKAYPFYLNIGFYAAGLILTFFAARTAHKTEATWLPAENTETSEQA